MIKYVMNASIKKLELAQYNVALATTEVIQCTNTEKLYQEFGFRVIARHM